MALDYKIFVPDEIEVVVGSPGGVGSSFLMEFLSNYKKLNHKDKGGYKHSPIPPLSLNPTVRYVFVHGDPVTTAISMFRRGFQRKQSRKLLRWDQTRTRPMPKDITLKEYAAEGIDRFLLKRQFLNWYERHLHYPTLFVRYETLFDNVEPLLSFLGIPHSAINDFPEKRARSTVSSEIDPIIIGQLESMYADYYEILEGIPDVVERRPTGGIEQWFRPSNLEYAKPIVDHFLS